MFLLLIACELKDPHGTPSVDDSTTVPTDDSTVPADDSSTDSTPPESKYTCVALDQRVPKGAAPAPSGYEYCSLGDGTLGYTHRVAAVACEIDWKTFEPEGVCTGGPGPCDVNADCPEGSVCQSDQWGHCTCVPKCMTDADCESGMVCVPTVLDALSGDGGLSNRNDCVSAECVTDDDCPSGPCVAALDICGFHSAFTFRCWTALDECHVIADCPDDYGQRAICTWLDDRFACSGKATCD